MTLDTRIFCFIKHIILWIIELHRKSKTFGVSIVIPSLGIMFLCSICKSFLNFCSKIINRRLSSFPNSLLRCLFIWYFLIKFQNFTECTWCDISREQKLILPCDLNCKNIPNNCKSCSEFPNIFYWVTQNRHTRKKIALLVQKVKSPAWCNAIEFIQRWVIKYTQQIRASRRRVHSHQDGF